MTPETLLAHANLVVATLTPLDMARGQFKDQTGRWPSGNWRWQNRVLNSARLALESPTPELLKGAAATTRKYLMRVARRKVTAVKGLPLWARTLLASALNALGEPPCKLPGTQPRPRKGGVGDLIVSVRDFHGELRVMTSASRERLREVAALLLERAEQS